MSSRSAVAPKNENQQQSTIDYNQLNNDTETRTTQQEQNANDEEVIDREWLLSLRLNVLSLKRDVNKLNGVVNAAIPGSEVSVISGLQEKALLVAAVLNGYEKKYYPQCDFLKCSNPNDQDRRRENVENKNDAQNDDDDDDDNNNDDNDDTYFWAIYESLKSKKIMEVAELNDLIITHEVMREIVIIDTQKILNKDVNVLTNEQYEDKQFYNPSAIIFRNSDYLQRFRSEQDVEIAFKFMTKILMNTRISSKSSNQHKKQ